MTSALELGDSVDCLAACIYSAEIFQTNSLETSDAAAVVDYDFVTNEHDQVQNNGCELYYPINAHEQTGPNLNGQQERNSQSMADGRPNNFITENESILY